MWCIFFDMPLEECKYRIRHRKNHPIIPAGEAGIKILDSMLKALEVPSSSEGFDRIVRLTSDEDVGQLLSSWGIRFVPPVDPAMESYVDGSVKLHKFPRTPHAFDLGGATRDDKVMNMVELKGILESGNSLIVEEKIDGANMGIFITPDGQIITQNRSHFVTSSYHPQFALLTKWIAQRTDDLWAILEPGRHVLFGEWMYATHSIQYNRLPGWFVAYDLFDRIEGAFYSRDRLAAVLALTSIPHIAVIQEGSVSTIDALRSLVVGPSSYNDSFREGIVIRVCDRDRDRLLARMKLVRPDFIAGNERWNITAKLITNQLLKPSS
jgi:atypical dual specificity phosphatase